MLLGRFDEASEAYEILYRTEPLNQNHLLSYVQSLKHAGNFVKLDALKAGLLKSGLMIIDEVNFDWKSHIASMTPLHSGMMVDDSNELPVLTIPMKEVNWTNYASTLHAMATCNYSAVFKKAHFDPKEFAILSGPCTIEINSSAQIQSQTQTQSLLLSSVQEYLTSSIEDLSSAGEAHQSKRRSTARKRDTKAPISTKSELAPADFIKNISQLLQIEEAEVINSLCLTEKIAISMLDKNNISIEVDETSSLGTFSSDALVNLIKNDNQERKSIVQRIFELLRYFFVETLGQAFPPALGQQMFSLSRLFHLGILSFENLKDYFDEDFSTYCLGVAELSLEIDSSCRVCYELSISPKTEPRAKLLMALFSTDKSASLQTFSFDSSIQTRFFKCLPHIVTPQSISSLLGSFERLSNLEAAELLLLEGAPKQEILNKLGNGYSLHSMSGINRLRLGRILLKTDCEIDNGSAQLLVSELFNCASAIDLDLNLFTEIVGVLIEKSAIKLPGLELLCLFWNLFSRRPLIPTASVTVISNCFVRVLNACLIESSLEVYSFLLNWMAQERCFGSCHALVPRSIFRLLCQRKTDDFACQIFAYSVAFSAWRFPSIFAVNEAGIEDWDRHPIGSKECQSLPVCFYNLNLLCDLIWKLVEAVDNDKIDTKLSINDTNTVACIDWLRESLSALHQGAQFLKEFKHSFDINRDQIKFFLSSALDLHATSSVPKPKHFQVSSLQSLRILLNFRSDIVHSELQGRKKSFEVLKRMRSDLKTSLSIYFDDAEVWALLGTCYYDSVVHFLSSDAELITAQQGKLKRCLKKAILCFQTSLRLDQESLESWAKLSDLCDWSLHYPSELSSSAESYNWLCSLGCRAVQFLLPRIAARDLWQQLLRLELFLRRSGREKSPVKLLLLLKQAVIASCKAYCENVYESTALYTSLAKFYSRLCKNDQLISKNLNEIEQFLPAIGKPVEEASSPVHNLLAHLDALNNLDRKKIFHAHYMTAGMLNWRLLNDSQAAIAQLSSIFPFLKPNKRIAQSLCQVYQSDHDRPARFLSCTKRYLLRLFTFIADSDGFTDDKLELLATTLKKLHYVRKTILGFPELLLAGTLAYFKVASEELSNSSCTNRSEIFDICQELLGSLEEASVRIPPELYDFIEQNEKLQENEQNVDKMEQ